MPQRKITITEFECGRSTCRHRWRRAKGERGAPKICPRCKSPNWNDPRTDGLGVKK